MVLKKHSLQKLMVNIFTSTFLIRKELQQQKDPWTQSPIKPSKRKSLQLFNVKSNIEQFRFPDKKAM